MTDCAIILAANKAAAENTKKPCALYEVLFRPMADYVISAVKAAGIGSICVVTDNDLVKKHFEKDDIKLFASLDEAGEYAAEGNAQSVVVLDACLPFADADTIRATVNAHKSSENDVTVISAENKPGHGIAAAACKAGVPLQKLAENNFSTEDFKSGTYNTENSRFFLTAENKKELNLLNSSARQEILEKMMECGVDIPCTDGIIIGPDCEIGCDTTILPNTIICGRVKIGEDCIIGPNSYIRNAEIGNGVSFNNGQIKDAVIMNNADIGPFVQIRPDSVIKDSVHLGNFVEVKNSVIDEATKVSHLTYVGDSDVGKNVNFGCGVVTVNFNGKTKNRTVIKDNAFIGCNTNLVAPVTVGENSYTAAGSTITKDVPDNTLSIARERQTNKEGWVKENQPYRHKV